MSEETKRIESDEIVEFMSELLHEEWVRWAEHLMEHENLSEERIDKWQEFLCDYDLLSEGAKNIDREHAQSMFIMIVNKFPELVNALVLKDKEEDVKDA